MATDSNRKTIDGTQITAETIIEHTLEARKEHERWWSKDLGFAEKSFRYQETRQKPDNFPDGIKFYARLNIVKDNIKTIMGIISGAKFNWNVKGSAPGTFDKERVNLHKKTLKWVSDESELIETVLEALKDRAVCGLGHLRQRFDKYAITNANSFGKLIFERLRPDLVKLDPDASKNGGVDGRYKIYDPLIGRDEFEATWGSRFLPNNDKIDVDKIFHQTNHDSSLDFARRNAGFQRTAQQKITVVQYDYWRWVTHPLFHPVTKKEILMDDGKSQVKIPAKEYRVAVMAGSTVLTDYLSELNPKKTFTIHSFGDEKLMNSVYSVGAFLESKPLQDMLNIILSLIINAQARQINSPIAVLAGAVKNLDKMIIDSGGYNFLVYDYPAELRDSGIPLSAAIPKRIEQGNLDSGFFALMQWLMASVERVSPKDVMKGIKPPGVESGVALSLLTSNAMIPATYDISKMKKPLAKLGAAVHETILRNLTDEINIPVEAESMDDENLTINKIVPFEEMDQIITAANEDRAAAKRLDMITATDKETGSKVTLREWYSSIPDPKVFRNKDAFNTKFGNTEFMENDLNFGSFRVSLEIDAEEERLKAERVARSTIIMESMNAVGSPITALEYGMTVAEDPDKKDWIEKTKKESEVWKLGLQAKQLLEEQREQQQQAQQQNSAGS